MITKVYIDNFRCFTNFELELGSFHLLLGENGSGKSTLFDVLWRIQGLLFGLSVGDCFTRTDLTAWDTRTAQDFAVEMSAGKDQYRYELRIEHSLDEGTPCIGGERLFWNAQAVYRFEQGEVHLYAVPGPHPVEGPTFPFDSSRSFLPLLPARPDNLPLRCFGDSVYQWHRVGLVPPRMEASSKEESSTIEPDGRNFSSWYRYLTTAHPEVIAQVTRSLKDVIPGMQHLRFRPIGETKWLEATFAGLPEPLAFFQLSDGQRALIALYTLLHSVGPLGYSLHIDEPDNYVCLREIQPWLAELEDTCSEAGRQAILISHHPELINRLAKDYGIWFSRPKNGPVRARKGYPAVEGLTAAETMARGWDDE